MNKHIVRLVAGFVLMASAVAEMLEDVGIGIEHGAVVYAAAQIAIATSEAVEGYRTARDEEG
jgi:hypothetical protein